MILNDYFNKNFTSFSAKYSGCEQKDFIWHSSFVVAAFKVV
jgi:hypothetical protein